MEHYDYAMAGDYYEDGMVRCNTPLLTKRDAMTPSSTTSATNGCFFAAAGGGHFWESQDDEIMVSPTRMLCRGGRETHVSREDTPIHRTASYPPTDAPRCDDTFTRVESAKSTRRDGRPHELSPNTHTLNSQQTRVPLLLLSHRARFWFFWPPAQEIENFDSDPFEKPLPTADEQLYWSMKAVMPDLLKGAAAAVRHAPHILQQPSTHANTPNTSRS